MDLIWGILIVSISLKCWVGQIIIALSPKVAVKIKIIESDVDSTFFADIRGEALWGAACLWLLPLAGILLILDTPLWAYFGLVGGSMYLYYAGRGIASRLTLQRQGIDIGKTNNLKLNYLFLTILALISIITIIMAVITLTP